MFRPHFAYPTPAGFHDENADYPFDCRQVGTGGVSPTGNYSMTLALDSDAPFLWRALLWEFADPYFFLAGQVLGRIRDAFGNYLSDNFVPLLVLAQPCYMTQPWIGANAATPPTGPHLAGPLSLGMGVPLPEELYCPASSTLSIDLFLLNASYAGTPVSPGRLLARGVKRRKLSDCASEYR